MNINKFGAVLAHIAACGTPMVAFIIDGKMLEEAMSLAIFLEAMAIYFNTSK